MAPNFQSSPDLLGCDSQRDVLSREKKAASIEFMARSTNLPQRTILPEIIRLY